MQKNSTVRSFMDNYFTFIYFCRNELKYLFKSLYLGECCAIGSAA